MNSIGLDKTKCNSLTGKLNVLLPDYMTFYQNTRALHWNIKGDKFFELHLKFEELYTNQLLKVDEIAERILTLKGIPLHTFVIIRRRRKLKFLKIYQTDVKVLNQY